MAAGSEGKIIPLLKEEKDVKRYPGVLEGAAG